MCQEYCGANCGRIFASYGGFAAVLSSLLYHNKEQKKKKYKTSSFFVMERITRLARLAFALADTHTTDEQSPGLFFASQRSFRVSHTTTKK